MARRLRKKKAKPVVVPSAVGAPVKKKERRVGRILFGVMVTVAVALVVLFIYSRSQGEASITENAVGTVLSPIQNAASSAVNWVRDFFGGIGDRNQLKNDYEDAQMEITRLKYNIMELEEAESENARLKSLLDARDNYVQSDPVYAKVVGKNPGVWFDTFSINKGSNDGISRGMAVITGEGLVGRVGDVYTNSAKVISIIDASSSVAGLIERTRTNGMVYGQLSSGSEAATLSMYYIASINDIEPGDRVLTSGMDGVYPKGLPIGTVQSVSRRSEQSDQYVVVSPSADFQRLEEVLVLKILIDSSDESLPSMPDPTPRPTPDYTIKPVATMNPGESATPDPSADNWIPPTIRPSGTGAAATLPPVEEGEYLAPEDLWAEEYTE